MHYFLSAGETSGDIHAARLITAIRERDPGARFTFIGGPEMERAAECAPLIGLDQLSVMGFAAVLKQLPRMMALLKKATEELRGHRPDTLVVIDFPTFNLRLAEEAHRLGIPVHFYILPKVWAWKSWRTKTIDRCSKSLLCILPFEPRWLSSRGVDPVKVLYVGNPSVAEVDRQLAHDGGRMSLISKHNLTNRPIIALVPGSREAEIRSNLPVMVQAAAAFKVTYQPVIAGAPGIDARLYRSITAFPVITGSTLQLMHNAEAALVTSGTATLECALAGTPQVVMYRANGMRIAYEVMKRLLKVNHVSLPNLILSKPLLPELLLHQCTPQKAREALAELLDPASPKRKAQLEGYADLRHSLAAPVDGDSDAATAARIITSS